jgi:parallel beta-helix repeat protein
MGTKSKSFALILVVLFLTSLVILPPINSQSQTSKIIISADGSIIGTNKIHKNGNIYTLTENLNGSIIIERDNIVLDGANFTLQGSGNLTENQTAISLTKRTNDAIENFNIMGFNIGIGLYNSSKCTINDNKIYNVNNKGIFLNNSWNNWIKQNDIETTGLLTVALYYSSNNIVSENIIINNFGTGIDVYGETFNLTFSTGTNNIISGNTFRNNSINYSGENDIVIGSSYNTVIGNNITNSSGILLTNHASGNLFSKNSISNCNTAIGNVEGDNNVFFENNIIGNNAAVYYLGIVQDTFYRNNFINNTLIDTQASIYSQPSGPNWDNGTVGNYWSDYKTNYPTAKEVGSTGTYDTPYTITEHLVYHTDHEHLFYDNHPLVIPVKITQPSTAVPSWVTPANQTIPILYVVIIVVASISVLLVSLLLYGRHRKPISQNKPNF